MRKIYSLPFVCFPEGGKITNLEIADERIQIDIQISLTDIQIDIQI